MRWHFWFVDLPSRIVDRLALLYLAVLAAFGITCLVTALLWYLAFAAGIRLP